MTQRRRLDVKDPAETAGRTGCLALGAVLTIRAGGRTVRRDVRSAYSYLAANDPRVHVGLGTASTIASIDVAWPGGATERFGPFPADAIATIVQGHGTAAAAPTAAR